MKDILLLVAILIVFLIGYFLMSRLDKFLDENRKTFEKGKENKVPSHVMLTEELSDDEILEEVKRFRGKHKGTKIIMYDSFNVELSEEIREKLDE